MARTRRAAQSAPQEVLVPETEQPYAVPENWRWVRGNGLLEPMESQIPTGPFFDYIDIDSIDNQNQRVLSFKRISIKNAPSRARRKLLTGDTLFSMVRPYLKNVAFVDASLAHCIASTGFYVCRPKTFIAPRFLYFLMTCNYVIEGLTLFMKGDNSPSIRKGHIENFPFPLPPRAEQERIVACIESLFSRLDKAREKVDAVLGRCAARKAALLHKAFSGELTTAWRKARGIGLESWKKKTLGDIIKVSSGKSLTIKKMVSNGDIPVYGGNGIAGYHNDYNVNGKVIVIGRVGFYCGSVHAIEGKAWVTDNALIVSAITNEKFEFLKVLLDFCNLGQYSRSTAQPVISGTTIYPIKIYLPSREEQAEIVRILDELLARERRAQEAAERVAARIEQIKRAVLTKAFRGELGTNDPAEPAALTEQGSLSLA